MDNFNSDYSRYYDLLYRDKDYEQETDYLVQLIQSVHPGATRLLELGCGTGNHASVFCRRGYTVTGLERSPDMVALANNKKIAGFTPVQADISHFHIDTGFDVALSLFHVIGYINSNAELESCFKAVYDHLRPGGVFIFDVWYSPAVYTLRPQPRIRRIEDDVIAVTRVAEPEMHVNENVVDVNYEIFIQNKRTGLTEYYKEKHPMRHFDIPGIGLLAKLTGFTLLKTEEFATGKSPANDTWSVCFILQKK